ncbi:Na/Pi cotransporter family protein [Pseudooceanicola nanhaiensis]|uniref:Na/Pi cotransporter family protein n=1 Tax=Pseudooceanicola nanhaiensis TaxID=375761 RepID=UPI001CD3A598|nr:Na/Pi symporter [Pseudooceanicola nanhaiensis]MCA0922829.1 Na/Pi symporter [Pseudooceanicola nanhaiensis]
MVTTTLNALGGIGLFLFGMIWLTDGLQALAGRRMRVALAHFTNTPVSGAATGAVVTALIQSSSATTVMAVGFVGAGLLTFPQALGVIFGANIGTTMTGWIAAILGFKLDLGEVTLPLVFVGAMAHLFGNGRLAQAGTMLAGFSLIFLGIEVLKTSLSGLEGVLTPSDFPADDLIGRLQLVGIGAAITLVTQSSSAGVATALALIGAGVISLPQGMALVIGMDVGTTGTAALATLGGSTAARRTGLSHVIYNSLTGVMAFALLGPFQRIVGPEGLNLDSQIALVAFHSGFNILGVVLILPFTGAFARLVTVLVRDRGLGLTRRLGKELLRDTHLAVEAAVGTLDAIVAAQFGLLSGCLCEGETPRVRREELKEIDLALSELHRFVDQIPPMGADTAEAQRLASLLHASDHARRLYVRLTEEARIAALPGDRRLHRYGRILGGLAQQVLSTGDPVAMEPRLNKARRRIRVYRERYRTSLLAGVAQSHPPAELLALRLDAMRWLQRVSYHMWRIEVHMAKIHAGAAPTTQRLETAMDVLEGG